MRILYVECNMGAAGDMLMAALLELHDKPDDFLSRLNGAGIPGVVVTAGKSVKCGITGTAVRVEIDGQAEEDCPVHHEHEHTHGHDHGHTHEHDHEHEHTQEHEHGHNHEHGHVHECGHTHEHEHGHVHVHEHEHAHSHDHEHSGYHNIERLISHLSVSDTVKKNASEVYKLIAEAESRAHGVPVSQIHFHEVGTMDAVADIVGVCMLIEELAPDRIVASPVNVGRGHVRCAHGILPVPAPATAHILQNVPIYSGQADGELCTPTGAALLKHFASDYCKMPVLKVSKIGYGMGKRDFGMANCVRAYIGNTEGIVEEVTELVCNLDDMTPEAVSFAQQLLFDEGALDVYATPIVMKKGRAGISLTCMCRADMKDKMLALIFKHTTTLGIREYVSRRYALKKEQTKIRTVFGAVRIKSSYGYGANKSKPEYDDIVRIALENKMSIQEVLKKIDESGGNS